jgi:hypothetical protein
MTEPDRVRRRAALCAASTIVLLAVLALLDRELTWSSLLIFVLGGALVVIAADATIEAVQRRRSGD